MAVQQEGERNWRISQLLKVSNRIYIWYRLLTSASSVIVRDTFMIHVWPVAHFSFPSGASLGANASIPFGVSSTTLRTSDAMQMGCCNSPSGPTDSDPEPKMPFLKKWVRTRHAILFRLSNRTVQVLFFDRRYDAREFQEVTSQLTCLNTCVEGVWMISSSYERICPNFPSFFLVTQTVRCCSLLKPGW